MPDTPEQLARQQIDALQILYSRPFKQRLTAK